MEINDILKLMQAVAENDLTSLKLEEGDIKLSIKKEKEIITVSGNSMPADMAAGVFAQPKLQAIPSSDETAEAAPVEGICSEKIVSSPLVGTFYNAASPDGAPFVNIGDTVKKGQTLGIIEAMKLMNEIESEYDGVIEAVLVGNEDVVEYGQPLFRIR